MKRRYAILILFAMFSVCLLFATSCGAGGSGDVGGTNIQEEGIDEGDIAKFVDGKIYKMQKNGVTVSALNAEGMPELIVSIPLEISNPVGLYVSSGRLIALYETEVIPSESNGSAAVTTLLMFDATEFSADAETAQNTPKPFYSMVFNAQYVESRIDMFAQKALLAFKLPKAKIVKKKNNGTETTYVDSKITYTVNSLDYTLSNVENLNTGDDSNVSETTVFMSIDLSGGSYAHGIKAVRGYALKTLYVSEYGFYPVFSYFKKEGGGCSNRYIEQTIVAKIEVASMRVKAQRLFENFGIESRHCLCDTGDNLFIAAQETKENVIVLLSFDDNLNLIGALTEICQDEDLKSVSYAEEGDERYCYVVTYLERYKYDPIFKINITDPKAMAVKGYLALDGYSDYTFGFDAHTVVGVGDDGNDGVQVALFDVKNDLPTLVNSFVIDNSLSPAAEDSRAFCVNRADKLFAIPVRNRSVNYQQGMYFYRINEQGELEQLCSVTDIIGLGNMQAYEAYEDYYVNRAFYSENYIYTVSDNYITVYNKSDILGGNAEAVMRLDTIIK